MGAWHARTNRPNVHATPDTTDTTSKIAHPHLGMSKRIPTQVTTHRALDESLASSRGSWTRDTPPLPSGCVWRPPPSKTPTNTLGCVVDALTTDPEWAGVLGWD